MVNMMTAFRYFATLKKSLKPQLSERDLMVAWLLQGSEPHHLSVSEVEGASGSPARMSPGRSLATLGKPVMGESGIEDQNRHGFTLKDSALLIYPYNTLRRISLKVPPRTPCMSRKTRFTRLWDHTPWHNQARLRSIKISRKAYELILWPGRSPPDHS